MENIFTKLNFSNDELVFIKDRYPNVDIENLSLPALGMATVTSMDLLKASIKSDLEYKNFENCINPLEALNICVSIEYKIKEVEESA